MRRAILLAWVASVAIGAAQTAPPVADTILVNGHIVTLDARFSTAQAVAIAGGGPGVDVSRARTMADLVAARVRQSRAGDIITSNSDWHELILNSAALRKRRAKERFL